MGVQTPLFTPESSWRAPSLDSLPTWPTRGRIGIDVETHDPQLKELGPGVRRGGYIAGISFAIEDGPGAYVPLRHPNGNVDLEQGLRYFRDNLKNFAGSLVGAHLSYDLDYLWQEGLNTPQADFMDVLLLEPLLDELQNGYSLDAVAARRGLPGKEKGLLEEAAAAYGMKSARAGIAMLPAKFVGPYAEQDTRLPLQVLRRQERALEEQPGVENVWALERKVQPVLVRMTRRGVRVDFDRLEQVENWTIAEERKALDEVHRQSGVRIALGDVWSADSLAMALEATGVKVPKTAGKKPKPSVTKEFLAALKSPLATAIARARQVNKIRTTFAASVRRHAIGDRIHCNFNQLFGEDDDGEEGGAAYGRLSAEKPNLQQQPARDPELGPMWRAVYLPEHGEEWCSVDYSQQEPRMTVHYAVLSRLPMRRVGDEFVDVHAASLEAADRYIKDPSADFHTMMAAMTGLPRKQAKEVFLGLCYGMGGPKLCRKLNLPTRWAVSYGPKYGRQTMFCTTYQEALNMLHNLEKTEEHVKIYEAAGEEGQKVLDQFDQRVPFVRALADSVSKSAKKKGYVRTLSGRRCRFPRKPDGTVDWAHKGLNRVIQGSSADQTKMALVAADDEGIPLRLQVHDEIIMSAATRADGLRLSHVMETVVQLKVPSKAEPKFGPNWGEAK